MRRITSSVRPVAFPILALTLFLALHAQNLHAADSPSNAFVYVMTNKSPGNSVIQYARGSDGSLVWLREVATGGSGTGATGVDPLASQDSLVLSGDGQFLFAVNAGSGEISVLGLHSGVLTWLSKIRSAGDFPNSLALSGNLLYVLNSRREPHINGFRVDAEGVLHPIPNARISLPSTAAGANDIRFTPDGTRLLISVSGTNQILIFEVGDDGVAANPTTQPAAGAKPFGIRFGRDQVAVISEAAGSASSYNLDNADMLNVISGAVTNTQAASCWLSLTSAGKFAYVSNTASGTVSSYAIDGNGDLTLLTAVAATTGGAPIDSALSSDSKFLYIEDSAQGRVVFYAVNGPTLMPLGVVMSLPTSIQGIAAQ